MVILRQNIFAFKQYKLIISGRDICSTRNDYKDEFCYLELAGILKGPVKN